MQHRVTFPDATAHPAFAMNKPSTQWPQEPPDPSLATRRSLIGLAAVSALPWAAAQATSPSSAPNQAAPMPQPTTPSSTLEPKPLAIGAIAATTARGDMTGLAKALNAGLDAGLTVSEAREILVQLYAYAGFPRALNALGELMKTLEARRQSGRQDPPGREPAAVPTGPALLQIGTDNQTRLSGAPVRGPLFEFAPAIDQFLKTHLFGDIFGRDNLDWQSRELATLAALSALDGAEPQLLAHVRISLNIGLSLDQLRGYARALAAQGEGVAAGRLAAALDPLADEKKA